MGTLRQLGQAGPIVRWDANRFTRALVLAGLPLVTVVLLLCAVAAYVSGNDYDTGYAVSQDGCTVTLARSPGGPPAVQVQGSKPMTGTCGMWHTDAKVYYDPATRRQVPGPGNNVAAAVVLGALALGAAVLGALTWTAQLRKRRS